jgi:parvulin-like peptidyl-prolyl isomerase
MGLEEIVKKNYPIATIDDTAKIMATDLYQRLAASDLLKDGGIVDSTVYLDTLNAIILDSIVSSRAKTADIKKDPSLYRTFRVRYDDVLTNFLYRNFVISRIKIDSADVEAYYRNHPELYSYREQVRARQLTINGPGLKYGIDSAKFKNYSAAELDSLAGIEVYRIKTMLDSGASFNQIAYDYSANRETGKRGGDMGYFPHKTFSEEIEKRAFSLPIGTISEPFQSPDGWHIIQIVDHVDSGMAPFDENIYKSALQQCRREMQGQIARRFIDSLMQPVEVAYNDSALAFNAYLVPDTIWAAIIDGKDTVSFYRVGDIFQNYAMNRNLDSLNITQKHDALRQEIVRRVLVRTAENMDLSQDTTVANEEKSIREKYSRAMILKEKEDPSFEPTDSMIADYYEINIDNYRFKKPIYVQHIIVSDSLFGEYLRDQALSGVDFLELAKQYYPGAEEIRTAAANLGYIGPGEMSDDFYAAALATNKGSVSHPVKTEWGYHIIKIVDHKFDVTLDQARFDIIEILKREHGQEYARQWEKKQFAEHNIKYDLSRLKRIELPPKSRR